MKTLSVLLILTIFFFVPVEAQWTSFDLKNVSEENGLEQVEPLVKAISLSTNRHFYSPININDRIRLGFSYSHGINFTEKETSSELIGGYPNFAGSLIITENLLLKGNISNFKSGNDIVQSYAYGIGLKLTNKENNNWEFSALFSRLRGPDYLKNRSFDINIINEFKLGLVPLFFGLGINSYNAKLLSEELGLTNKIIKGNANHLLIGVQFINGRLLTVPILQLNSEVMVFSLEISGAFK